MLNHTGGIRDQWELLAIAGTRLNDVITQEQILKILGRQQALNFRPGTDWSYSNSGYTLLGEIVRSVSGQTLRQHWPVGNHLHFEKYDTAARTEQQLIAYTGTYYSPELDCIYRIVQKDHHLVLTNAKYNDSPLTLYGDDHLLDESWWMNHLHILRDAKHRIIGFELNGNRTMHLKFVKINCSSIFPAF